VDRGINGKPLGGRSSETTHAGRNKEKGLGGEKRGGKVQCPKGAEVYIRLGKNPSFAMGKEGRERERWTHCPQQETFNIK